MHARACYAWADANTCRCHARDAKTIRLRVQTVFGVPGCVLNVIDDRASSRFEKGKGNLGCSLDDEYFGLYCCSLFTYFEVCTTKYTKQFLKGERLICAACMQPVSAAAVQQYFVTSLSRDKANESTLCQQSAALSSSPATPAETRERRRASTHRHKSTGQCKKALKKITKLMGWFVFRVSRASRNSKNDGVSYQ